MIQKLKKKLSNRFVQNVGWLGASQFINRIFRLGTTVVTARVFTPEDFGLIAIIATVHQFILTLAATGLQEKIAQAKTEKLEQTCNTVYWLNWLLSWTVRSSRKINEFTRVSAPNAHQLSSGLTITERLSMQGF